MSPLLFAVLAPFVVAAVARWGAVAAYRRKVPALGFLIVAAAGASTWALGGDVGTGLPSAAEQAMGLAIPWLGLAWLDVAFSVTGRRAPDSAWPLQVGAGVAVVTSAVAALAVAGSAEWGASPAVAELWRVAAVNGAVAWAGSALVVYEYASDRRPQRSFSVGRVGAVLVPVAVHGALAVGHVPMAGGALAILAGAAGIAAWPLRAWGPRRLTGAGPLAPWAPPLGRPVRASAPVRRRTPDASSPAAAERSPSALSVHGRSGYIGPVSHRSAPRRESAP
ncbi:hypothetical protein [Rubrivirga sp.]|uniref:hypothetical protein n=1 Tax=Rubrivirga sp. TaxID=1885344 RepID=UPI003B52BC1F